MDMGLRSKITAVFTMARRNLNIMYTILEGHSTVTMSHLSKKRGLQREWYESIARAGVIKLL